MNRNPLIATPTVDKNGKNTTVYRKAASSASGKTMTVPKVMEPKTASRKTGTLLPVPDPIANSKLGAYNKSLKDSGTTSLSKNFNAQEAGLVHDIIARGHVSENALLAVTGYMGLRSAGERIPHYDYNMLMLLERFCRDEGSEAITERPHSFADAVEGLGMRRRESDHITVPPITTEEELDSFNAVVKMMVFVAQHEENAVGLQISERKEYRTVDGDRLNGRTFRNHSFTALLREQYDEYSTIQKFVADRGVPLNKAGVDALRDYLASSDEQHNAVSEGWL